MALSAAADDDHLLEPSGVFAAEAHDIAPGYAPATVNADSRPPTWKVFQTLLPLITVVLCSLPALLKLRDRSR